MSVGRFTRRDALRRSALLLLAGAGGSILSACAAAPATPTTAPAAPTKAPAAAATTAPGAATAAPAATAKPAASGATKTIQWFTPAEIGLERDFYTKFANDFMVENPSIKVEASFEGWNDYMTKLPTVFAGGAIPDANHLHVSLVQDYGTRGAMKNMFEYMDRDKVARDMYFKPLIYQFSDYKTHTKLYAVPKDSATYAIYYNKDLFDKAGVPYPKDNWSFQDFRNAAKMLTVDKAGNRADSANFDKGQIAQWGFTWVDPLPSSDAQNQLAWAWFGNWYNDDFTKSYYDKPEAIEYLQFFADMRCKDRSIPTAGDALGQGDPFRNQITAMQIGHHSMVFFYNAEKKTFKYDSAFSPTGPGGSWSAVACSGHGVATKAKNPEEGWMLVKFLTSEAKQCEIVSAKRWGSASVACEKNLLPTDNIPPSFEKALVLPLYKSQGMQADTKTEAKGMIFPPFHNDIKQVFVTEFDAVANCGNVTAAEAAKKIQPQVQAILDKAAQSS